MIKIRKYIKHKINKIIGNTKEISNLTNSYNTLYIEYIQLNNSLKNVKNENKELKEENNQLVLIKNRLIAQISNLNTEITQYKYNLSELEKDTNIKISNYISTINYIKTYYNDKIDIRTNKYNDTVTNLNNDIIRLEKKLKFNNISLNENINLNLLLTSIVNLKSNNSEIYVDEPLLYLIDVENGDGEKTLYYHAEKLFNKLLNIGKNRGLTMGSHISYKEMTIIFNEENREDIFKAFSIITNANNKKIKISINNIFKFISSLSIDGIKELFKCYI